MIWLREVCCARAHRCIETTLCARHRVRVMMCALGKCHIAANGLMDAHVNVCDERINKQTRVCIGEWFSWKNIELDFTLTLNRHRFSRIVWSVFKLSQYKPWWRDVVISIVPASNIYSIWQWWISTTFERVLCASVFVYRASRSHSPVLHQQNAPHTRFEYIYYSNAEEWPEEWSRVYCS